MKFSLRAGKQKPFSVRKLSRRLPLQSVGIFRTVKGVSEGNAELRWYHGVFRYISSSVSGGSQSADTKRLLFFPAVGKTVPQRFKPIKNI